MSSQWNSEQKKRVIPGVNPLVRLIHFTKEEREIINRLSIDWYITSGGKIILSPTSVYNYLLIKPTDIFQEMFNLDREIVLIFSPYENFEPRTLAAITEAAKMHQTLRIERICSVLISKDPSVELKLSDLLKNDQEAQIVVPFTYVELLKRPAEPFFLEIVLKNIFIHEISLPQKRLSKKISTFLVGQT